jgi:hypothetical protein
MASALMDWVRSLAGLTAGGLIGVGFGMLQNAAFRRNKKLQAQGSLDNGWALMPGSMRRVAYLLLALVLVQILCPLLFINGTEWWVSGGVVAGYGAMLFRQLRRRGGELS